MKDQRNIARIYVLIPRDFLQAYITPPRKFNNSQVSTSHRQSQDPGRNAALCAWASAADRCRKRGTRARW